MDKLFIASNNPDKIREIKQIVSKKHIECQFFTPKDFNDHSAPVENGFSFKDNAIIKARYYYEKYHMPTLADDSGLCISYLHDLPGVHSSRFMEEYSYHERNDLLIKLLEDVSYRDCRFVAAIAYIKDNDVRVYEGKIEGKVAFKQAGDKGFGYDPLFYVEEYAKTLAELDEDLKNKISHRAKALRMWANENLD